MKLFDYYRSSASYRVRIALCYKNIPCDLEHIHLMENGGEQHSESFTQKNHQQLVPLLEDKGITLNQSFAILEYLEDNYDAPPLLPSDKVSAASIKAFALEIACEIHPLNNLRVLNYLNDKLNIKQQEKLDWYHHWLKVGFSSLEQKVKNKPFCFGETPTWADIFLIPQIYNAKRFNLNMKEFPKLADIYDHCLKQSYFIKASPEERYKSI